jgi:hypothetical protein
VGNADITTPKSKVFPKNAKTSRPASATGLLAIAMYTALVSTPISAMASGVNAKISARRALVGLHHKVAYVHNVRARAVHNMAGGPKTQPGARKIAKKSMHSPPILVLELIIDLAWN